MSMHIPIIKRMKERNMYVITCDYIPENEGHAYADEAYYDSTTDMEAVLSLAQRKKIDAILTFNSDPAALTAAYVADKLHLPGSGYEAVKIMSEKDSFRNFLKNHGFNVPKFNSYSSWETFKNELDTFEYPVILKPVDSSGSKGVIKIEGPDNLETYFISALSFSRCKRVIVEEYIESFGPQLHGDAFVYENNLKFIKLGDHHFDISLNSLVPYSTTFPSIHSAQDMLRVEEEVRRFISLVGFRQGGINIEARISSKDRKVYLIEVGPRNGGNFTPLVIQYATGYNFVDAAINSALGSRYLEQTLKETGCFSYLILHSERNGIFEGIEIENELKEKILESYIYKKKGDSIFSFSGANAAVGVLIVGYDSLEEMNQLVNSFSDLYIINLL